MWSCDDCDRDTRRLRGKCGRHRVRPELPGAAVTDEGEVGIPGYEVVGQAKGAFGEGVWFWCPVAMSRRTDVRRLIDLHQLRARQLDHGPLSAQERLALLVRSAEDDALRAAVRASATPPAVNHG